MTVDDRFTVHRSGDVLTVWCGATGTFELDPSSARVDAATSGQDGPELEHRLACVVVPLLLAERGDLALHASAVAVDGQAVAFAGVSGRGKSTIAWALGTAGRAVLAEDGCIVTPTPEGPLLWPGLAGVRLRGPASERMVVEDAGAGADPVPLRAVVLLGPRGGSSPAIGRLSPVEALTAVMPHTMHAQGPSLAAAFRGAGALTRTVPVLRGSLPDDLSGASRHAERLLDMVLAGTG